MIRDTYQNYYSASGYSFSPGFNSKPGDTTAEFMCRVQERRDRERLDALRTKGVCHDDI